MDEGSIIETGLHKELLEKNGRYSEMYRLFEETTIKAKDPSGKTLN